MLKIVIYLIGFAPFVWVVNTMIDEVVFARYFWVQKLHCWKCITLWSTLIVSLCVTLGIGLHALESILLSVSIASTLSFIADRLDKKINRNSDNEIKL